MVKINEMNVDDDKPLFEPLPFDIAEDLMVFMRNDPLFYRRNYFEVADHIRENHNNPKKINKDMIERLVNMGFNEYIKKYKIQHPIEDIFTNEEKNAIIQKIIDEELENLEKENAT